MNTYDYKALAQKVNNYWQNEMPDSGICSWERSAYMLGNLAAYDLTGNEKFLDSIGSGTTDKVKEVQFM